MQTCFLFLMRIVDKLVQIIAPHTVRGTAIEYGCSPDDLHGNSLYDYELNNWRVICFQKDKDCFDEIRIFRRLAIHLQCNNFDCQTIDDAISNINLTDIEILLIRNTDDCLSVVKGFSLERRNTQIICVEQSENSPSRSEFVQHLKSRGYLFLERVLVSDVYIKDNNKKNHQEFSESIFEV